MEIEVDWTSELQIYFASALDEIYWKVEARFSYTTN